jgi:acyl-homoserine lactone acylase PvdQ
MNLRCWLSAFRVIALAFALVLAPALAVDTPSATAFIRRDTWGIPHIQAESELAAAFALGQCQAEDRLEQLFSNYRKAIGRMAEVEGAAWIEHDLTQRTWQHEGVARRYLEAEAPREVIAWIEALQEGVRAWMREHPERVPANALELHPAYAVALGRHIIYGWQLSQIQAELGGAPGVQPRFYSNQWTVAPSRTADQSAVLLIDPHLPWEGEYRFYENHVSTPDYQTCGFSVVGTPGIGLGHNAHLGWACTTGGPDTVDVYALPRRAPDRWEYRHEGEWVAVRSESVSLPCRQADGRVSFLSRTIHRTPFGPVLADTPEALYAARTAYDDQAGMVEQLRRMNRARTMDEFFAALRLLQMMDQNIMGADVDGNIFYVRNGRVPRRARGFDWNQPVPGETAATAWQGFHPFEDLIRLVNPPTGYMQNCNVAPDAMAHVPLVRAADVPSAMFHARPGDTHTRGLRANELLARHSALTREQAFAIVADTQIPLIDAWKELWRQVAHELGQDSPVAAFHHELLTWDGRVERTSTGATAFEHLVEALLDLQGWGRIGPEAIASLATLSPEQRALLVQGIQRAAERMQTQFGTVSVPWGQTHRIVRGGSWPVDGAGIRFWATLRPVGYDLPSREGLRSARSGQSHVLLVFFKRGAVESFSVTPYGISDDPASPHHSDQTRALFSENRLKPTWFGGRGLEGNTTTTRQVRYP